jgi:hypothetical protein
VLDRLAPGVALAGCADDAHARLGRLTDDELIGVLRAWARQASWAQARELAAVTELARRRPADGAPPGRAIGYGHAPRARPAPGTPAPGPGAHGHPADGWTITLTTERIARGQSP